MTIADVCSDLRFRIEMATHPKDWADACLRLRILARRLAVESRTWRPNHGTQRALARLLQAIEAARIPSDWEVELRELAVAVALSAGMIPRTGP